MFREAASSSGLLSTVAYPDPVESFEDVLRSTKSIADASGLQLTGLVVRHASAGVPQQIAQIASRLEPRAFVINAGDGSNEDPTLALAHILWLLNTVTSSGSEMKCLIVGDLALDPLARSLAYGLSLIGAQIQVVGPISLVPAAWGAERNVIVNHTLSSLEFEPDVVFGIPISRPMSEDVLLSEEEYKIVVPLDNFAATTRTALFIKCENSKPNIFIDPFASLTTLTLGNRLRTLPAEFKPAAIYGALRFCEIHQSPSN